MISPIDAEKISQVLKKNYPFLLDDVKNTIKTVFRYTIHKIERAGRYIVGGFKSFKGKTLAQRSISVHVKSAKDTDVSAWVKLGLNNNIRGYRASLEEMVHMHPDATAIALRYEQQKNRMSTTNYASYQKIPASEQAKCVPSPMLHKNAPHTFQDKNDLHNLLNKTSRNIESKNSSEFQKKNGKPIKTIVEAPPFITRKDGNYTPAQCTYDYIEYYEAFQAYLTLKYGKEVQILVYRSPERNQQYMASNNTNYDKANQTLSKISPAQMAQNITKLVHNLEKLQLGQPPTTQLGSQQTPAPSGHSVAPAPSGYSVAPQPSASAHSVQASSQHSAGSSAATQDKRTLKQIYNSFLSPNTISNQIDNMKRYLETTPKVIATQNTAYYLFQRSKHHTIDNTAVTSTVVVDQEELPDSNNHSHETTKKNLMDIASQPSNSPFLEKHTSQKTNTDIEISLHSHVMLGETRDIDKIFTDNAFDPNIDSGVKAFLYLTFLSQLINFENQQIFDSQKVKKILTDSHIYTNNFKVLY